MNNVTEDDRILFPGDAEFSYIEAARANISNKRVYETLKPETRNPKPWRATPRASALNITPGTLNT